MPPMQNPTDDEAEVLIRLKRDHAKVAMDEIVKSFCSSGNTSMPGIDILLEYLTNMVYALELRLKVLSDDWREPGKSKHGHKVGEMYKEIFAKLHGHPTLMQVLERAILNQKFLFEPAEKLLDCIPDLEALWDELQTEFNRRNWGKIFEVNSEVSAPENLKSYLRSNLPRFYKQKTYRRSAPVRRTQSLQMQIRWLQLELQNLEASGEPPQESQELMDQRIREEYEESLKRAAEGFDDNLQNRPRVFSFSFGMGGMKPSLMG
jgi:hypothetical protein